MCESHKHEAWTQMYLHCESGGRTLPGCRRRIVARPNWQRKKKKKKVNNRIYACRYVSLYLTLFSNVLLILCWYISEPCIITVRQPIQLQSLPSFGCQVFCLFSKVLVVSLSGTRDQHITIYPCHYSDDVTSAHVHYYTGLVFFLLVYKIFFSAAATTKDKTLLFLLGCITNSYRIGN